jgi:ribosomal protein L7Ae-like RNA K-turn-binding protein
MVTMDKFLKLLGLAMRAGRVVSGEAQVVEEIRAGNAHLVVLATDAAKNSEKKIIDKCVHYGVPLIRHGTREELGRAIGKEERVTIAVLDAGFAKSLSKLVQ